VRQPNSTGRDAFRQKAERDWEDAFKGKTRPKASFKKKRAAIDSAQAEIINFLATDNSLTEARTSRQRAAPLADDLPADSDRDELWAPDPGSGVGDKPPTTAELNGHQTSGDADPLVNSLETVAESIIEGALEDIASELGGTIPSNVKIALADHFWCDLLAQLAHAIDEGLKHIDSVPDRIADWVMKSREKSRWRYLDRPIILPIVRLLAILICKAPERHQAVVECCVDPLSKRLFSEIKERLVRVLPEWLPQLRGAG
jgi:hypothetical protein